MKKEIKGIFLILLLGFLVLIYEVNSGEEFLRSKFNFQTNISNFISNNVISYYIIVGTLVIIILLLFLIGFLRKYHY